MGIGKLYQFDSQQLLPVQTEYFSIAAQVDKATAYKTAIAVDILRKYYKNLSAQGQSVRVLVVNGYRNKVSLDAILLGIWYLFSKFYGEYPDPLLGTIDGMHIGWNGPVDNPTIDIPMAHEIYDSLVAPASSYQDKKLKLQAMSKYFYCGNTTLMGDYDSYNDLEQVDKDFYDYVVSLYEDYENQVRALEPSIITQERKWVFDVQPYALFYDSSYFTTNKYDLLKDVYIQATKEITSLTGAIEQDIYNFTRKIYPISYYLYVAYLYRYYVDTIVKYVKPYHASYIYTPASVVVGRDSISSIKINEDYSRIIIKGCIDSIINYLCDSDFWPSDYDISKRLKEYFGFEYDNKFATYIAQMIYRTDVDTITLQGHYYYKNNFFELDTDSTQLVYNDFNIISYRYILCDDSSILCCDSDVLCAGYRASYSATSHNWLRTAKVLTEAYKITNDHVATITITSDCIDRWQNYNRGEAYPYILCDDSSVLCDDYNISCAGYRDSYSPIFTIDYSSVVNTMLQKLTWYTDHVTNNFNETIILLFKEPIYILNDIIGLEANCTSEVRFAFVFNIDSIWWYYHNARWWFNKYNDYLDVAHWTTAGQLPYINFNTLQMNEGFFKVVVAIPPGHTFRWITIRYRAKETLYQVV